MVRYIIQYSSDPTADSCVGLLLAWDLDESTPGTAKQRDVHQNWDSYSSYDGANRSTA